MRVTNTGELRAKHSGCSVQEEPARRGSTRSPLGQLRKPTGAWDAVVRVRLIERHRIQGCVLVEKVELHAAELEEAL